MLFSDPVDAVGHTPLVHLRIDGTAPGVNAYAKLEMQNLFAMKDRVARQVVLDAKERGDLADGAPIVESSSGTMALGLALVGTYLGHPVHIVTDPRIDPITLAKLDALGCEVHVVAAMTSQGWQSARLERLAELISHLPGAFWPRQYSNPGNPLAYRTLAAELRQDLDGIDVLVGSVGSGGSLCGTTRALREDVPGLYAVGVDSVGSLLFAQPDRPQRRQSGLGNSLQPENVDYSVIDEVHWLSDDEAFAATKALAREQKLFAGNTSGSVYRILGHLARHAEPGTTLVGIFPDRGDRYVDSVYGPPTAPVRSEPVEVRYGTPVEAWAYARLGRARRRLVFVESNTTGTGMMALRTAARLGVEPVLLSDQPSRYAGLPDTGARVIETATADRTALRRAVSDTAEPGLAGIVTTSEYYLVACAELAAEHGLPGNPAAAVAACRDKVATRTALTAAGLPQPLFVPVAGVAEVADAVKTVGLPCVVKPTDESGSVGVQLCVTAEEAEERVAAIVAVTANARGLATAGRALVEQLAAGPELSVEMFGVDGDHRLIGVTRKRLGEPPYFVETGHVFPVDGGPVVETVRAALKAVGMTTGATHTEVRSTVDGPVVIEINARPAGGMIPELVRLATGVDLLEQQLRAVAGLPLLLEPARDRVAGIRFLLAPAAGVLAGVAGVAEAARVAGVNRVVVTASAGAFVEPARDFSHRLGHVIAVGDTEAAVETSLDEAMNLIRIELA
jgi:S-sulfo-L-cysteine synthase (3-phospho-L-serine-dependent)